MSLPERNEYRAEPRPVTPRLASWIGVFVAAGVFAFGWILCVNQLGWWIGGLLGWWPSAIVAAVAGLLPILLSRLVKSVPHWADSIRTARRPAHPGDLVAESVDRAPRPPTRAALSVVPEARGRERTTQDVHLD
jgi:hypothetical protein